MMERQANKILDIIADGRYSLSDIDYLGFHVVNLSTRQVRKNALTLADSIIHYSENPFSGDIDGQDTLF
jgi:hypothetical protein